MELRCPVKTCVWGPINSLDDLKKYIAKSGQPFGVDESGPACNVIPTAPCDKTYYEYLGLGLHKGIDIPVSTGTEVYAATDGVVSRVSDNITQGIGVVIYDKTQNVECVFWHLKNHVVFASDIIKKGQLIGYSDNTGYSLGPHLHFQINLTNEYGQSLNAVDPMSYFVWDDMRFVKVGQEGTDVWCVVNSQRSLVYNALAFQLISGNWNTIEVVTQEQLDAIPDTGKVIVGASQE